MKPSRTPFRRPIRFQSNNRRRAGAPVVPDPFQRARYRPKGSGIIKFFQANEVLRRETEYHICPLGAVSMRRPVFPLAGPIGILSWLRTGWSWRRETIKRTLSHDHCNATPTACAR